MFFGAGVGGEDLLLGQVDGVAQVKIVAAPGGDVLIEHVLDGLGDPGGGVNAVGDGVDGELREHGAGDLAVLHGDSVGVAGEAQGEEGHVQHAVGETALLLQAQGAVAAEDADGLLGGEAVVAGGDRGVGGEDALFAHLLDVGLGGLAERAAAELALEEGEGEQRGVALVHVVDVEAVAEGVGHADAAHAQHDLLLEAVVGVAAVEMIGEAAVPAGVRVQIGVEEVDWDGVAVATDEVVAPSAQGDHAAFDGHRYAGRLLGAEISRIPGLDVLTLGAGAVQVLLEVSLAVDQGKGDQGNAEIGGGPQGIARQHAQAAGVGGHGGMNGDLH